MSTPTANDVAISMDEDFELVSWIISRMDASSTLEFEIPMQIRGRGEVLSFVVTRQFQQ